VTVKASWYFSDVQGENSTTTTYADSVAAVEGAGGVALMNALIALAQPQLNRVGITSINVESAPGTPEAGPYATERESLTLEFVSTGTGKTYSYNVPAPDEALIGVDDESPIPDDENDNGIPDVLDAAIGALQDNLTDPHGFALTFKRAYRGKTRPRK